MPDVSVEAIRAYRVNTFRLHPGQQVHSPEEAVGFVKERGFIFFWPLRGYDLPSLWVAVAGDRPVADEHDDPGHQTWGWKDSLLGKRLWYYAKIIRKKATFISLDFVPNFYALSENYGSPEEDYITLYKQGRLSQESKAIFEALLKLGPLDTIALRKEARLFNRDSETRFNKGLTDLQANFQILPIGIADAGAWHYSYIYDLVFRYYPEIQEGARYVSDRQARKRIAEAYVRSLGITQVNEIVRLFGWQRQDALKALEDAALAGSIVGFQEYENHPGEWWVWKAILAN